jgi:hypothetical protein
VHKGMCKRQAPSVESQSENSARKAETLIGANTGCTTNRRVTSMGGIWVGRNISWRDFDRAATTDACLRIEANRVEG